MEHILDVIRKFLTEDILTAVFFITRFILPILAIYILFKAFSSLLRHRRDEQTMAVLENLDTNESYPIQHWENSIGRSTTCDIVLNDDTVSRNHAVLARRTKGWFISDTNSKYGILINDVPAEKNTKVTAGDVLTFGESNLLLRRADMDEFVASVNPKRFAARFKTASAKQLLWLVTIFQLIAFMHPVILCASEDRFAISVILLGVIALQWVLYFVSSTFFKRTNFEIETIAMLLCSIGFASLASMTKDLPKVNVKQILTQAICLAFGMILYMFLLWFIKDLKRVMRFRHIIGAMAIVLFAINILYGQISHGANNWIEIAGIRIQPSEFIKIAFIFAGASTLNRLQEKNSLVLFLIFCGICTGSLFLISDFGSACIFFMTFIIISFMRSGDIRTLVLICAGVVFLTIIILLFKPYIIQRFASWRHVWDDTQGAGFQQTYALIGAASGGLFGNGIGAGFWGNTQVFAAENDLIFAVLCEEWGLILAIAVACVFPMLSYVAFRFGPVSRSAFYNITSCAASSMLLFQACLNIFGSMDVLPFTGVTLPLISLGGSSMISVWGLLAFIKATDERTYHGKKGV